MKKILASALVLLPLFAHADTVVVGGLPDYSAQYPTLAKLCVSAHNNDAGLTLGTAVISPFEVVDLGIKCNVSPQKSGKTSVSFDFTPSKTVIQGTSVYRQEVRGWATLVTGKVKNQYTEADLVFESYDFGTIVEHLVLNLNANGQPVNTQDHFEGTMDPQAVAAPGEDATQYASGFYFHQTAQDTLNTCVLLSQTPADSKECVANGGEAKTAVTVSAQFMQTITLGLGWLPGQYPTNHDLDHNVSRVDFQKALTELGAFLKANNNDSSFDVAGAITEAKKAIKNAAAN